MTDLASHAAHFRRKAEDPEQPERDRKLWKQLADEIDSHLSNPDEDDQPTLMEM